MDLSSSSRTSLNRRYIHTILGINYLTLFVADMDQAFECLKKAGAEWTQKPRFIGRQDAVVGRS